MSSLSVVESLLNEFYQTATSNARKREIEIELISFKNLPNSWQICLTAATRFEVNQYLWFFCTSTVEHAITRRWAQMTSNDRAALRESLWITYANISIANVARRQKETLAQLIAIMGKREFADQNPNYMRDCLELAKSNLQLGIPLLRIISEEVVNNRDGVSTDRRRAFHASISTVMPSVLDLITKYLLIGVCHLNDKDVGTIENCLVDYTLLPSLPNDCNLDTCLVEVLKCAQHLVSWAPIDLISEYFLLSILDLCQWRNDHSEVSLAALHVLNEILYLQKTVPYVMTLMNGVNGLLSQHNLIKCQNEMYDDKFRELLRLYTTKYWTKLIHQNEVFENFLKLLYCFTIIKNGALDFAEKLEAWTPIIKGLIITSKLDRFFDLVHQLVAEIMRRSRFETNKIELEILDNECFDENMQTEWQQYLSMCFECIALVAEPKPKPVFEQVYSHWTRPYIFFMTLENGDERAIELSRKMKNLNFNEQLRDMSSVCQVLVRIAPLLEVDTPDQAEVSCHMTLLTDNLLALLNFFISKKLTDLCNEKSELKADLQELFAQVLMALRSLLSISSNLKSEQKLRNLTELVGNIFLQYSSICSTLVYSAASELLLCITSVVRPKFVLDIQSIVNLLQCGPHLSHLPKSIHSNIYTSLTSYLILPWRNTDDRHQDFHRRCEILREYFESIGHDFLELETNTSLPVDGPQKSRICSVTLDFLSTLKKVIEFFKDSNNMSKEMLTSTIKPIIMKSLILYECFGLANIEISVSVSEFCLGILRTLQNQLGSVFVKDVITLFISVSSREHLTDCRLITMEKVLQMFQLVIEQPGNSSLSMLPSILDFTLGQVLPIVRHNYVSNKSDITYVIYSLFDSVLNCKWQYFYKSLIQHTTPSSHAITDNMHPEHFVAILTAYGEVLVNGHDPNLVRIVLESLQRINEKWSLYSRQLFKENLLTSFLQALLKILLSGGTALNYELLVSTLFSMGQVDTSKLCDVFSSVAFPGIINTEELCLSTDIPTFSQKLSQMLQDTYCCRILETI